MAKCNCVIIGSATIYADVDCLQHGMLSNVALEEPEPLFEINTHMWNLVGQIMAARSRGDQHEALRLTAVAVNEIMCDTGEDDSDYAESLLNNVMSFFKKPEK